MPRVEKISVEKISVEKSFQAYERAIERETKRFLLQFARKKDRRKQRPF
jgi:hypothetical protein